MGGRIKKNKNMSLIYAIILFFLLNSIGLYTMNLYDNQRKQEYQMEVFKRFLNFQSDVEQLINNNSNLMIGYLTFIETNDQITEEMSNLYLEALLSKQRTLIRNIGIIKDTTIHWNYPSKGNTSAIGIDLAEVDGQSEDVLHVKRTLEPMFIGPVNLVQGGTGFITRMPIIKENQYWGQISIVMDGNKFLNKIDSLSRSLNLEIAIFNNNYVEASIFFGNYEIMDKNPIKIDFQVVNDEWKIAVIPLGGWSHRFLGIRYLMMLMMAIIFLICYFSYNYLNTRYILRVQATTDYLTGLYNRNYLDHFQRNLRMIISENSLYKYLFVNLDIDGFKGINDTYGHKIGDEVLKSYGKNLDEIKVVKKTIIRLGGDEFLMIVELSEKSDIDEIRKVIRESVDYVFRFDRLTIPIVSSIGCSLFPDDSRDLDELINIADVSMYENKRSKKSTS